MNVIDLFGGVGGLSLGFEKAGASVLASVDNWDEAISTYNHNRPPGSKTGIHSDVKTFNANRLKDILKTNKIHGVIGGPPCQGFSSARLSDRGNKMIEIDQERNSLYLDFYRTVKQAMPDFFLIENVRGMATFAKGELLEDIYLRFGKLGYSISHKIVDMSKFGLPQKRVRIFVIGIMGATFEFPAELTKLVTCKDALSDLPGLNDKNDLYVSKPRNSYQRDLRQESTGLNNHVFARHDMKTVEVISKIPDGGGIKDLPEHYWSIRKFNKAFQRMNSSEPSLTIDTGHRNYFHYSENRIPTVRECARLQSFPDHFEFLGSRTSQYRQVGNAVPPLMAKIIALEIFKQIGQVALEERVKNA
jgi:DNA (cytosine-5)-methyltransferase 1